MKAGIKPHLHNQESNQRKWNCIRANFMPVRLNTVCTLKIVRLRQSLIFYQDQNSIIMQSAYICSKINPNLLSKNNLGKKQFNN